MRPFNVDDGDLGRGVHPDFDTWFERLGWACLPCGGNGYVFNMPTQKRLAACEITFDDVMATARVDLWGLYRRRRDHRQPA